MTGDSLAEQPNNPEKEENLESDAPVGSQEEPKIEAPESVDLKAPQLSAQQADVLEIQEIESISPQVELPEANNSEIQESLQGRITPEVALAEANYSETQASLAGSIYPNVPPSEANNSEIQENPEPISLKTLTVETETSEIQDLERSISPEVVPVEANSSETQASSELISPEVFPAETNTSEIQESLEGAISSEVFPVQGNIETQASSELISPEVIPAETNTSEIQESLEGAISSEVFPVQGNIETQGIEGLISPNLSLEETKTSETQESLRLEIPQDSVKETNDLGIQETPESNTPEISLEETDTEEIQETPESIYPQKSYRSVAQFTPESLTSSSTNRLKIFITGASGCIGHYIAESLIQETDHELYLLVRNPGKLQFDYKARPGIKIIQGDIRETYRYEQVLKTVDCAVLAATAWGGQQEVLDVNVFKTIKLLNALDPKVCQQVIYFSTASVLDRNNKLLKEANELGTDYIRSKYEALNRISKLAIAPRVTTLFPTLVLGGDANHPYSHISSGLPGLKKWIKYIRFFKADASFHFLHARDIAKVAVYLIENPPKPEDSRWLVLGNREITVNEAVEEACAYLQTPIVFRLNLSPWLANLLIYLFNIQMAVWDRFCLEYRHFTYQNPVNPETFGLPVYCRTFRDVLRISGIDGGEKTVEPVSNYRLPLDDRESGAENDK